MSTADELEAAKEAAILAGIKDDVQREAARTLFNMSRQLNTSKGPLTREERAAILGPPKAPRVKKARSVNSDLNAAIRKQDGGAAKLSKIASKKRLATNIATLDGLGLYRKGIADPRTLLNTPQLNIFKQGHPNANMDSYRFSTQVPITLRNKPFHINNNLQLVGGPEKKAVTDDTHALIPLLDDNNRGLTRALGTYYHPSISPNTRKILYRVGKWIHLK
jgi:hypothetical protein